MTGALMDRCRHTDTLQLCSYRTSFEAALRQHAKRTAVDLWHAMRRRFDLELLLAGGGSLIDPKHAKPRIRKFRASIRIWFSEDP